jgi:para-nitrobenzyl esterase
MRLWFLRSLYFISALAIVVALLQVFPLGKTVAVETAYGVLLGKQREGVNSFLGVSFAKAPVGNLRWRAPELPDAWKEERKAFDKSPACLQGAEPNPAILTGESEDCLYLNIWVPEGEGPFPIMLWYHGGGFLLGSGSEGSYDGQALAEKEKIAVVTANYRLGYLGYLRLPQQGEGSEAEQVEGNQAYLDQVAALKWLKENASAFNIDSDNITIFGESAGSMSTCMLLASPLTNGLISQAILQSGSCASKLLHTKAEAEDYGEDFLEKIGCKKHEDPLRCARAKSHEQIYQALGIEPNEMFLSGFDDWSFSPAAVTGTDFLPMKPLDLLRESGKKENLALMVGVTADEGSLFDGMSPHAKPGDNWTEFLEARMPGRGKVLAELYPWDQTVASGNITAQMLTDAVMTCPSLTLVDIWSEKRPAYFYYFNEPVTAPVFDLMSLDWTEHAGDLGVAHSTEIPYIFRVNGVLGYVWNKQQKVTRDKMSNAWANFSKYGDPNGPEEKQWWPAYTLDKQSYAEFLNGAQAKQNLRAEFCNYWQGNPLDFR